MRVMLLVLVLAGAAQAAVPEAIRQLPFRREVRLPATPPADAWCVVEMDSLLAAVTGGALAAMRLVDDTGEPVPAVVLEPRWPEFAAVALPAEGIAWTKDDDDPPRLTADIDLPPGDYLRVDWSSGTVDNVDIDDAERIPDWRHDNDDDQRAGGTWRVAGPRARITVVAAKPDVRLERLVLRADRVRSVPFVARPGTFRGATYEQVIDLPAGPHAVLSVRVRRGADTRQQPVMVDLQRPGGGWERSAAAARDVDQGLASLGFEAAPILARTLRLSYDQADPPNAPFSVEAVEAVPPAFAFAPTTRGPLWLVYGELPVPAPPGVPRGELRSVGHLVPLALGEPAPSPWFAEKFLGTTWLRRRPLVVTAAMVLVLAVIAALVVTERRGSMS